MAIALESDQTPATLMNSILPSVLFLSALALCCPAQDAALNWQRRAITEFPDLAVENSPFNSRFLELLADRRKEKSPILQNTRWPLVLAEEIALKNPELVQKLPKLITKQYRVSRQLFAQATQAAERETNAAAEKREPIPAGAIICIGVVFVPGRFAMYSQPSETLVVKGTPEQHEEVRQVLTRAAQQPTKRR